MRKIDLSILMLVLVLSLSGCVMKKVYVQSFLELRENASTNYSQQIIDVIVNLRQDAKLPVFFSIEAGNAVWSPRVTGSFIANIPGPWNSRTTGLSPSFEGSDSANNSIQFNDFGSAAMIRINSLYEFLCFPFKFGDVYLSNGTLFSCVSESDSSANLYSARKLKNGKYIGVPPEKKVQFLAFASEVTYWSQNANPSVDDLRSAAGVFYRFSIEYIPAIQNAIQSLTIVNQTTKDMPDAQAQYESSRNKFDAFLVASQTSTANPDILNKIVETKQSEITSKGKSLQSMMNAISTQKAIHSESLFKLENLKNSIQSVFTDLVKFDPDIQEEEVKNTLAEIQSQIDRAKQGDMKVLTELKPSMLRGVGLDANESVDELYRERFESLPQRFDPAYQGTN